MVVEASTLPMAARSTGTSFCETLAVTTGTGPPSPPPRRVPAADWRLQADADTNASPRQTTPDQITERFNTTELQNSSKDCETTIRGG